MLSPAGVLGAIISVKRTSRQIDGRSQVHFLKMEVIHSPGATFPAQRVSDGVVDNFRTFNSLHFRCPAGATFSAGSRGKSVVSYTIKKEEMNMDLGLKGKEAIVTGGTRGSSV